MTFAFTDMYRLCPSLSVTQLAWRPDFAVKGADDGAAINTAGEEASLAIASEDSSLRILLVKVPP